MWKARAGAKFKDLPFDRGEQDKQQRHDKNIFFPENTHSNKLQGTRIMSNNIVIVSQLVALSVFNDLYYSISIFKKLNWGQNNKMLN